jgi:hypothetical protein
VEFIDCGSAADWEAWLEDHYEQQDGVWLRIAKKGSGQTSITITEALDVALCYGWIDSQRNPTTPFITCSVTRAGGPKAPGPNSTLRERRN